MGAMIAALFATGASAGEIESVIFEEFVQHNPFGDYRPSLVSLARGERGKEMLKRCFGEAHLEAMTKELVVVSTDLYDRRPVYHRRGLTAEAVAASICLPVLFPPQVIDSRVLVDGSLSDNCPTAAFAHINEGPVVAVRIGSASSGSRSGRTPSIGETLMRAMQMGDRQSTVDEAEEEATITVTPDTRGLGLLEFHQLSKAREAGLRAGEAAVTALRQSGLHLSTAGARS